MRGADLGHDLTTIPGLGRVFDRMCVFVLDHALLMAPSAAVQTSPELREVQRRLRDLRELLRNERFDQADYDDRMLSLGAAFKALMQAHRAYALDPETLCLDLLTRVRWPRRRKRKV